MIVPTRDEGVRLVADFVRRLRRVALHPLALDDQVGEETPMPGDLLRKRVSVEMNVTAFSTVEHIQDGPGRRGAVRVAGYSAASVHDVGRPSVLRQGAQGTGPSDRLGRRGVCGCHRRRLRRKWRESTSRSPRTRAYRVAIDSKMHTDIELPFAWPYQDGAHGDESTTGYLGVGERFAAAVGVFAHIAVVALNCTTLTPRSNSE